LKFFKQPIIGAQVSITKKPERSFPPVKVQIISTGTKENWAYSNIHITDNPHANAEPVWPLLKINAI